MHFTKKFGITDNKPDFFDINIFVDTKKFVDPYCISQTPTPTGIASQQCINAFMKDLLGSIQNKNDSRSAYLCSKFKTEAVYSSLVLEYNLNALLQLLYYFFLVFTAAATKLTKIG